MYRKCLNPNCNGNRRDTVALKTTCIKTPKRKIIKIGTGCHYRQRKPKLSRTKPSTEPHAACGLDIASRDNAKRPRNFFSSAKKQRYILPDLSHERY